MADHYEQPIQEWAANTDFTATLFESLVGYAIIAADFDGNIIAYTFRVPLHGEVRKRFNIAPTQDAPVVRLAKDGTRELAMLRWGLVPFWSKDPKSGTKMINARSEGVESKPAFRDAVKRRRCIVPATGFFEWRGEAGRKQPFAITVPAFFPRENPISRNANPACMNMTRTAATTTQTVLTAMRRS